MIGGVTSPVTVILNVPKDMEIDRGRRGRVKVESH